MNKHYLLGFILIFSLIACTSKLPIQSEIELPKGVYRVMDNPQDLSGNPEQGLHYLTHGPYIGSGIPISVFKKSMKKFRDTVLNREGNNQFIPYENIAFKAPNGGEVVSGSCFSCHSGRLAALDGEVLLDMGGEIAGFQGNLAKQWKLVKFIAKRASKKAPLEQAAFTQFNQWFEPGLGYIRTDNPQVNPAFRLEEAYAMHRNPSDLSYSAEPLFDMNEFNIGSDVPPLWHVKKKKALYYNGMGRGDYSKVLMQASTQGIKDSAEARTIQQNFKDVVAWLYTLEPPKFPGKINRDLARTGETVFMATCEKCHGTYGNLPYFPNKIIPLDEVKTDPFYALYFLEESNIGKWYNESWYAQSKPTSEIKPSAGYMAPPLDGIWATAPYLHNASVPTLEDVLNSSQRPTYWSVRVSDKGLAYEIVDKIGLDYEVETKGKNKKIYDTTLKGYGNQGHDFGDKLSDADRKAVIEYLKTL